MAKTLNRPYSKHDNPIKDDRIRDGVGKTLDDRRLISRNLSFSNEPIFFRFPVKLHHIS